MAGMHETCTVCGRGFEVQFRYQMEERDNAFSFFCSQSCHGKSLRGETTSGVVCDCCNKRFVVELVSQVVRIKGEARYACSDGCATNIAGRHTTDDGAGSCADAGTTCDKCATCSAKK